MGEHPALTSLRKEREKDPGDTARQTDRYDASKNLAVPLAFQTITYMIEPIPFSIEAHRFPFCCWLCGLQPQLFHIKTQKSIPSPRCIRKHPPPKAEGVLYYVLFCPIRNPPPR